MKTIEFRIKDGKVEAKAIGYKGSGCESTIKKLLAGLGESTGGEHIMPDFYENEVDGTQAVEGGA